MTRARALRYSTDGRRDLAVQLADHDLLKVTLHQLRSLFTEDTPTAVLVCQVLGAISQFEKASAVAKLADRRRLPRGFIGQ